MSKIKPQSTMDFIRQYLPEENLNRNFTSGEINQLVQKAILAKENHEDQNRLQTARSLGIEKGIKVVHKGKTQVVLRVDKKGFVYLEGKTNKYRPNVFTIAPDN